MERRLTDSVPLRVAPLSTFVQPGDVDAVVSEMFDDCQNNENGVAGKKEDGWMDGQRKH